jgi:hypothetical protein
VIVLDQEKSKEVLATMVFSGYSSVVRVDNVLLIAYGAISIIVGLAAGKKRIGLFKAPCWTWTVSRALVLGVAAYQHFKCPSGLKRRCSTFVRRCCCCTSSSTSKFI